jgi:heme oxygenase
MLKTRGAELQQRLRQETAPLHGELDAALAFPERCDLIWYHRLLTVNSTMIPIEAALAAAGIQSLLPDWPDRQRGAAIKHDLAALGLPAPPPAPVSIDPDPATLLGWAYVLEGSRLGARFILKFVEATAPPEIRAATQFLSHGFGKGFWPSFQAVLQGADLDQAASARACNAARAGFSCFLAAACPSHAAPAPHSATGSH